MKKTILLFAVLGILCGAASAAFAIGVSDRHAANPNGMGKCLSCGCMGFIDGSCGAGVCRCGHGYSVHI